MLRQGRQLIVGAEVVGAHRDRLLPSLDACGQRGVDVPIGLFGGCGGRSAELADTVENPPRLGLLFGLVCQEGELHGHLAVRRVDFHGAAELIARQFVLAHLYIGVAQVLVDGGAFRRKLYRLLEK